MPEINLYGQTVGEVVLTEWRCRTATGNACRSILSTGSSDADSHAADLFDAYAQAPDDRDRTWLVARPTSVEAAACWVEGNPLMPSLVPLCQH